MHACFQVTMNFNIWQHRLRRSTQRQSQRCQTRYDYYLQQREQKRRHAEGDSAFFEGAKRFKEDKKYAKTPTEKHAEHKAKQEAIHKDLKELLQVKRRGVPLQQLPNQFHKHFHKPLKLKACGLKLSQVVPTFSNTLEIKRGKAQVVKLRENARGGGSEVKPGAGAEARTSALASSGKPPTSQTGAKPKMSSSQDQAEVPGNSGRRTGPVVITVPHNILDCTQRETATQKKVDETKTSGKDGTPPKSVAAIRVTEAQTAAQSGVSRSCYGKSAYRLIDNYAQNCIINLAEGNEYVSIDRVMNLVKQHYQVENISQLGLHGDYELDSLKQLQRVQSKIPMPDISSAGAEKEVITLDEETSNSQTSDNVTEGGNDDIIDITEEKADVTIEIIEITDGETSQEEVVLDKDDRSEGDGAESDLSVEKLDEATTLHSKDVKTEEAVDQEVIKEEPTEPSVKTEEAVDQEVIMKEEPTEPSVKTEEAVDQKVIIKEEPTEPSVKTEEAVDQEVIKEEPTELSAEDAEGMVKKESADDGGEISGGKEDESIMEVEIENVEEISDAADMKGDEAGLKMWPPPDPPSTASPLQPAMYPPPSGSQDGTSHTTDAAEGLQRQSSVASEGSQGNMKRSEMGRQVVMERDFTDKCPRPASDGSTTGPKRSDGTGGHVGEGHKAAGPHQQTLGDFVKDGGTQLCDNQGVQNEVEHNLQTGSWGQGVCSQLLATTR